VTFDENAPYPHDVFECAGYKEMEESIFVDEGHMASTVMKMNHYFHLYHHSSLFLLPHLKQSLLKLPPPPQQQWRHHRLMGRLSLIRELPLTFRRHIHLSRS
jgi:hypothetical protein